MLYAASAGWVVCCLAVEFLGIKKHVVSMHIVNAKRSKPRLKDFITTFCEELVCIGSPKIVKVTLVQKININAFFFLLLLIYEVDS